MNTDIINRLQKALEFYRELGFEYLPIKKEIRRRSAEAQKHEEKGEGDTTSGLPAFQPSTLKETALKSLREEIGDCHRCRLAEKRKNIVFGEGSPYARIMFIGEGPGRDEDIQARPFVGDAGKLLTNLIVKLGLKREEVYIGNIVKCRPPNNRNPEDDEITACRGFIEKQIDIIMPRIIVCLGKVAAQSLLSLKTPISRMRGNFFRYNNIPVMPTFHPAYLLRNPKDKWLTWDDMQKVLEKVK